MGAEPGDRVEVDEPIAQIETDKVAWKKTFVFVLFLLEKLCFQSFFTIKFFLIAFCMIQVGDH